MYYYCYAHHWLGGNTFCPTCYSYRDKKRIKTIKDKTMEVKESLPTLRACGIFEPDPIDKITLAPGTAFEIEVTRYGQALRGSNEALLFSAVIEEIETLKKRIAELEDILGK
jgi:hypothetical protein